MFGSDTWSLTGVGNLSVVAGQSHCVRYY